jgi:uncharacterized membrane protein YfcA
MLSMEILVIAAMALFVAGTIKGFVGLGLPTVSIALMTLKIDPRAAISLILVPMLVSNIWQASRGGHVGVLLRKYWRFSVVLFVMVGLTVWVTQDTSDQVLLFCLGLILIVFAIMNWRRLVPEVPVAFERPVEILLAGLAGVIGGMTAGWAAPVAIYLTIKRVNPNEFVQASGLLICVGGLPLMASYMAVGHTDLRMTAASLFLTVPTLMGFAIGERFRKRTDPEVFKSALLLLFFGLGLNLLYKSTIGY